MGLDGVELIMDLEEEFGVSLPDADLAACRTPRDMIDLIWSKVQGMSEPACKSQRAFYALRRAVVETLKVRRGSVRPTTPICSLIPGRNDVDRWQDLSNAVGGYRWPCVHRPLWMSLLIAVALAGLVYVFGGWVLAGDYVVAALIAVPLGLFLLLRATRQWRRIPHFDASLAALVPYVPVPRWYPQSREDVAERVKGVTIENLGLSESEYAEDADFAKDLGVG